jgi:hypothetical protein
MNFLESMREILKKEGLLTATAKAYGILDGTFVPDRVPCAKSTSNSPSGTKIEWDSPLFGLLVGEVVEATASTVILWHPLTEKLVTIPSCWVTRTLPSFGEYPSVD